MGKSGVRRIDDQQGDTVIITEVGASAPLSRQCGQDPGRPLTARRRLFICGFAIVMAFVGIQTSSSGDTPPTSAIERAIVDPVSACAALADAAPGVTTKIPQAYTRVGIIKEGATINLGLMRPDGLVQLCRDQVELAAEGVTTRPRQDELTPLPAGMSYVYRPPSGVSKDGVVLRVAGVRLEDGTVAQTLILPDGRVAPGALPTTK